MVAFSFMVQEPQRDHRAVEREVAIAEFSHVAQQFGFRAMGVEDGMDEERAVALQREGQRFARGQLDLGIGQLAAKGAPHRLDGFGRRRLVDGDTERAVADPQIDLLSERARYDFVLLGAGRDRHRVEERLRL